MSTTPPVFVPGRCALYRIYSSDDDLLYVGISSNPLGRLDQHFAVQVWRDEIAVIRVEHFASRDEAEEAERHAIRDESPRYNLAWPAPQRDVRPAPVQPVRGESRPVSEAEVSVPEAAAITGVSAVRIRQQIADETLPARKVSNRWLVDLASIPSGARRGRPMSARVAWALAELADGRRAPWLRHDEAYRLRARRDELSRDAEPELLLRSWLAARAQRHQLAAPDPQRLLNDPRLVPSGISDPRSGMSAGHQVEAYVHVDDLEDVHADHLRVPAERSRANMWLHAAPLLPQKPVPLLLLAADLAELGRARDLIAAAFQDRHP